MRSLFARIAFCFALCFALAAPAQAATSDDALLRCASMFDQQARLACYDGLLPKTIAPVRPDGPPVLNAPIAARPAPQQKKGWFSGLLGGGTRAPANYRIAAHATSYSYAPLTHILTIALDNGQVWRQQDGDTNPETLIKPARAYSVTIEPGALGSYNMHIRDVSGVFKVNRVR